MKKSFKLFSNQVKALMTLTVDLYVNSRGSIAAEFYNEGDRSKVLRAMIINDPAGEVVTYKDLWADWLMDAADGPMLTANTEWLIQSLKENKILPVIHMLYQVGGERMAWDEAFEL